MMERRRRSWVLLLLGLGAMALAAVTLIANRRPPVHRITLTAGPLGTTRALVARTILHALEARGVAARLVAMPEAHTQLDAVDAGRVDFALVSEAYRAGKVPHVREVTPLYMEAVHFLVKAELADDVAGGFAGLRGHVVDLGAPGSTTAGLATAVLAFAGATPGESGYVPRNIDLGDLERLIAAGDRAALPDATVLLATLPSELALELVRGFDYRLIPLPFAEAFRLNAVLAASEPGPATPSVERQHVTGTVIPAFTYRRQPPVPAEPLPTIGARLNLVAHESVPPETVELVLETLFSADVARLAQPPLDPSLLALPSRLPRHDGTIEYLRRDKPFITENTVDTLGNTFSVLGAIAGGSIFLWQWWRQRRQAARDEEFATHLRRMADVERRLTELELSATLALEPLVDLQQEVLTLKSDVLERYAAGALGDRAALGDLLVPLNATRDHLGDLLLHVRTSLEEQAQAEGRSATALWTDAIDQPDDPSRRGAPRTA
ncbi:MAG: hypothetical protein KIT14_12780 [bacterium]|nr:hypothetical protein [bacterium]